MVTSRYPYGGADQVAMTLVRAFEARHELFFITTGETDDAFDEDGHRRIVIGLPRFQMFWHHYWNRSVVRKLERHLAQIAPDVVHFHSVANRTFSAAALLVSRDYPTVWSLHDLWSQCVWYFPRPPQCRGMLNRCVFCRHMPFFSIVNKCVKEGTFRRADLHVVTVSHWQKGLLAGSALAGMPIEVIPNGIGTSMFTDVRRDETRKVLGISEPARVVVWAGQMMNRLKGHADLMDIAERVLADEPDIWFVFVGRHGEMKPRHPHFVLTGEVPHEEMPHYLSAADVFAYPTHVDSFGLVAAEAMAAGLPVVAYSVMAIPELIVDAETGILVEENDDRRFELELRRLLADEKLRHRMGEAGRRRIQNHYTLETQLAKVEALYERVLGGEGQKRVKHRFTLEGTLQKTEGQYERVSAGEGRRRTDSTGDG